MAIINLKEQTGSKGWKIKMSYEVLSQSIADNSTKIKAYLSVYSPYESWNQNKNEAYYTIYGGGKTYYPYHWYGGWQNNIGSRTFTVEHNPDGSKSIALTGYFNTCNATNATPASISFSQTITLPAIPREAKLTSAPSFNDTENPTIKYKNPAGNAVDKLEVRIDMPGNDVIGYQSISKIGTSYTFNLDKYRNDIYTFLKDSNSKKITYRLRTTINGTYYYSEATASLSIVNAAPTVSGTVAGNHTDITGSSTKVIRGYSTISASMTSAALKGASIVDNQIYINGRWVKAASVVELATDKNQVQFYTKDSRGNTKKEIVNLTVIPYVFPTCNADAKAELAGAQTSTIHLSITGNWFSGSLGTIENTKSVKYHYRETGGTWSALTDIDSTFSSGNYKANVDIPNLDYRKTYEVEAQISDKLNTVISKIIRVSTLPIFNWHENDFNFNVPVTAPSFDGEIYWKNLAGDTPALPYLPTNGGTINGDIQYKTTHRTSAPMIIREGNNGTVNGRAVIIGDGGTTYIGGGEAANTLYDNLQYAENERLYLCSDGGIYINTNCQNYGERHEETISTSGHYSGSCHYATSAGRADIDEVVKLYSGSLAPGNKITYINPVTNKYSAVLLDIAMKYSGSNYYSSITFPNVPSIWYFSFWDGLNKDFYRFKIDTGAHTLEYISPSGSPTYKIYMYCLH